MVDHGYLLDAPNRAGWGAGLLCEVLPMHVREGILLERNARISTLLRTVVDQAVLADVHVARASAASPVVCLSASEILLKPVDPAVAVFAVAFYFSKDAF